MAMTAAERLARVVARAGNETTYINTLNVADRVTIDFVWYPGEPVANPSNSLIDTLVEDSPSGTARNINYTWERTGSAAMTRRMNFGRVTIRLPQGASGTLTVFGTSWRITRSAAGVAMDPVANMRGVQQRLNRLGYHLRSPGSKNAGADSALGARTEHAILQFQTDYRPVAGAPAAAASRQQVRGEWALNVDATFLANLTQYGRPAASPNPTAADGPSLQASLVALVGA